MVRGEWCLGTGKGNGASMVRGMVRRMVRGAWCLGTGERNGAGEW